MPFSPLLDIAQPQLDLVLGLLANRLPEAAVIAFGSRVHQWPFGRGSKPYSDLDLAIWPTSRGQPDVEMALAELRADFEDSALPWRVDVSLAQDLPVSLRHLVLEHGVSLKMTAEHAV